MRISKSVFKTVLFILVFVLINALPGFFLEPFRGSSMEMWQNYRQRKNIDMIYVGSSQCVCAMKPDILDKTLGTKSYNMGTNMQSFHNSYLVVRSAVKEKKVKRVILVIDYEMLDCRRGRNFRAEASFQRAMNRGQGIGKKVRNDVAFVSDPDFRGRAASVNYFFPWIYDRDMNISQNVREKMAGKVLDSKEHRDKNGFLPSEKVLDSGVDYITLANVSAWQKEATTLINLRMTDESRKDLEKICLFCRDNQIELDAITVPYPNFITIYSEKSYIQVAGELKDLFRNFGFSYYDFNLAKPSLYQSDLSCYSDNGHMNTKGASRFSLMYANFLKSTTEREALFDTME